MDLNQKNSIKINLNDVEDISCDECGSKYFAPAFIIKKLSSLLSPSGKESFMPIQIFQCISCNHVNEEFKHNEEE